MKLNKIDAAVQAHWADNLINAVKFYRTGDVEYYYRIEIFTDTCEYCKKYVAHLNFPGRFQEMVCCKNGVSCPLKLKGHELCRNLEYHHVSDLMNQGVTNKRALVKAIWEEYKFLKTVYGKEDLKLL